VRTALIAALCKDQYPRLFDAFRACRDRADLEAVAVLSRFDALDVARERLGHAFLLPERPFAKSRLACLRILLLPRPPFGGFKSTPARRAFDNPIAIACFGDLTPCFPSRT
jgi:hypothetical protein